MLDGVQEIRLRLVIGFQYNRRDMGLADSIDSRYILGRDNYTCQCCNTDITNDTVAGFPKIDEYEEDILTNTVTVCAKCNLGLRSKDRNTKLRALKKPPHIFSGRLIVVTGPMFAEKSTTTRSLYNKYNVFNSKHIWVKPDRDNIKEGYTRTHNNEIIAAHTISASRPDKHLEDLLEYTVIAIDEAQFFSDRLLYLVHQLLIKGVIVIVNGLKLTAKRHIFGVMHYLLAEADEIINLKAVCSECKIIETATRTKSYQDLPSVKTGGSDDYYAACPACDGRAHENNKPEGIL